MPRFFCDYSNTYLTHDSAAGRKQQRRGWKFRENFKIHYEKHLDDWRAGTMGLAAAQQGYLRAMKGNYDPHIVPPLPEGWKEELDDATGLTFYVYEPTQERSWTRPGFIPPPGPPPTGGGPPPPNFRGGYGGGHHHHHHHHHRPPPQQPPFNAGPMGRPPFHQQQQQQQPPPPPPQQGGLPPPHGVPPPFLGGPPPMHNLPPPRP